MKIHQSRMEVKNLTSFAALIKTDIIKCSLVFNLLVSIGLFFVFTSYS